MVDLQVFVVSYGIR